MCQKEHASKSQVNICDYVELLVPLRRTPKSYYILLRLKIYALHS
jgi:hypothetical protein